MSIEDHNEKVANSKKLMVWFAGISIFMLFAGLTSAYIVSASRPDWDSNFALPPAFKVSTVLIVLSSITFHFSKLEVKKGRRRNGTFLLMITFFLGIAFVGTQFSGFNQAVNTGNYFTGRASRINSSFLYVISIAHIVHVVGALVAVAVVNINNLKHKYSPNNVLGIELAANFWHFIDLLWIYVYCFLLCY
jgi:cytochrome c oxidase subunit III